jgi:hypothetical protein
MMRTLCTLFDSRYLTRGLVLHRSLLESGLDFELYVLAMDDQAEDVLRRLSLARLVIVPIEQLERADPEFAATKRTRTMIEYCWTATPCICWFVLNRSGSNEVTYVDADVMFHRNPEPLFKDLDDASIALVPHDFSPEYEDCDELDATSEESGGRFNVQFNYFHGSEGRTALSWWRDRTIEWCYDKKEDGKYGDQKYLDSFPARFESVRILDAAGVGAAPWNTGKRPIGTDAHGLTAAGRPLIFHHYQSLQLFGGVALNLRRRNLLRRSMRLTPGPIPLAWRTGWSPTTAELTLLWEPYVSRVSEAYALARTVAPGFSAGIHHLPPASMGRGLLKDVLPDGVRRSIVRAERRLVGKPRGRRDPYVG